MDAVNRLHDALERGRRFSVIRSIVAAHPEAVTTRATDGSLAIHVACYYRSSLRVIQYLFRKFTESLTMGDEDARLPLHYACYYAKPIDLATVRFLVEECPETVMAANNHGYLPIHCACERKDSAATVRFLIESSPECIKHADNNSHLPLHHACLDGASFEMVQLLVEEHPQGVQMTDRWGWLPLHRACETEESSPEVVRLMLEQFPQGVSQRILCGFLPVHIACINGSTQTELVQLLINAFPESLVDESSGNHLLHNCCRYGYPYSGGRYAHPNLVTYFVRRYPEAVKMRNDEGDLPLHICADSSSPSLEKLTALIEADPWALVAENADGMVPLEVHLDAMRQASDDEDGKEDEAHNARQIMEDTLRDCIQEMRQSFCEATLHFNLPDGIVNHVFAFAVPHVRPEAAEAD